MVGKRTFFLHQVIHSAQRRLVRLRRVNSLVDNDLARERQAAVIENVVNARISHMFKLGMLNRREGACRAYTTSHHRQHHTSHPIKKNLSWKKDKLTENGIQPRIIPPIQIRLLQRIPLRMQLPQLMHPAVHGVCVPIHFGTNGLVRQ